MTRTTRHTSAGLLTTLVAALLALAGLTWSASAASAHSVLVSMSPKDKAIVSTPPTRVVLTFNEDVNAEFSVIKVVDGAGASVASGSTQVVGGVVSLALRPRLANGTYTVRYKVVSTDGHPVSGMTTFTVAGSTAPTTSSTPSPSTTAPAAPTASAASPLRSDVASSPPLASDDPTATTTPDAGGSAVPWVVAIVVVLALLGGGLVALLRHRRGASGA